jgi:predicted MFS family arabinose efflux permease
LRGVPNTVGSGLRLARRDRIVLRLLMVAATTGVALAVLELVTPAWLDRLVADPERAAMTYALLVTVGFGADAFGAALAPAARRRLPTPAVASAVATAVALAAAVGLSGATLLSGTNALLFAGIAYVVLFVGLGAAGPPLGEVLHGQVRSTERATVLSVQSLVLQLSGAAGALLAGALTAQLGAWLGFGVAAIALAAAGLLLLRMPVGNSARPRTPCPAVRA